MPTPAFVTDRFPEIRAGGFDRFDGTVQFYIRVNALLQPDFTVLDFGAGRGVSHIDDQVDFRRGLVNLRGKVKTVIGVDVDDVVTTNPNVDSAIVLKGAEIPLSDASIDLILSDFTFEHLAEPNQTTAELDRILKPGGWICARTPNRKGYIAIMNMLMLGQLKDRVLRHAQPLRKEEDVFPAFYRLNSIYDLEQRFPKNRYDHATYSWDASPSYHFNKRWVHQILTIAQYLTPPAFRTILFIFMRKKVRPD